MIIIPTMRIHHMMTWEVSQDITIGHHHHHYYYYYMGMMMDDDECITKDHHVGPLVEVRGQMWGDRGGGFG